MTEIFGSPIMGGGGSDLNYKVIAVASESALPSTAAENTIAVITTAPITSYVFSSTAPASPAEGMVWFATWTASTVGFDAIKRNGLWVYPTGCQQYVSGAWVTITAKSYLNGAWADWWDGYYYKDGNPEIAVTGGWNKYALNAGVNMVTFDTSEIHFGVQYQSGAGYGGSICTKNKIDVTNLSALIVKKSCQKVTGDESDTTRAAFGLISTAKDISPAYGTAGWVARGAIGTTQAHGATKVYTDTRLDVSNLTGKYYLTLANEWTANYVSDGGVEMWVQQIWGETL